MRDELCTLGYHTERASYIYHRFRRSSGVNRFKFCRVCGKSLRGKCLTKNCHLMFIHLAFVEIVYKYFGVCGHDQIAFFQKELDHCCLGYLYVSNLL